LSVLKGDVIMSTRGQAVCIFVTLLIANIFRFDAYKVTLRHTSKDSNMDMYKIQNDVLSSHVQTMRCFYLTFLSESEQLSID